ncbi:ClpXP protease specificity-enhancing factor [Marinomonas ostreistagni]|uniref:ClpXP protease specificity-enhancing factor n=1 Tax=Marinomonas ostreistagni TaxID=359209 RepID=A0ABS0Z8J8_9GAMM|nr:ClpXP protease specificity-enhancing factor [Marinomonas ostreistagni]MBJ7549533.1 ClpXP protease specificity-enhancing factor [Marinomonas ostreistagni]
MIPKRSYFLNATYEWIADNDLTPYLLVDADFEGAIVPREFVNEEGQIVLNISMNAVRHLHIDKQGVSFEARFSGKPMQVFVPMAAAIALYAKENSDGMVFPPETFEEVPEPEPTPPEPPQKGFTLKVVK